MLYLAIAIVICAIIFSITAKIISDKFFAILAKRKDPSNGIAELLKEVTKGNAISSDSTRSSTGNTEEKPAVEQFGGPKVETGPKPEDYSHLVSKRTTTAVSFGQEDE